MTIETRAPSELPYAGIRVIDFGTGVAGAEVGRLLADWGAETIKIEGSAAPDFIRTVIPGLMNPPFSSSNRSKQSFGVDLKTEAGRSLLLDLIRDADVVVENSATGVLDRLGLSYEAMCEVNPKIILFSTQLMGARGPWKHWVGYGPNAHAASGLQQLWNYAEDAAQPAGSVNIHPDHLVARLGALAVAAALIRRAREGCGSHIEIAQFEVLIQLMGDLFARESMAPGTLLPTGNDSEQGAPWGVYPCAGEDEWCAINVKNDEQWRSLCGVIGMASWAEEERFAGAHARRLAAKEIRTEIERFTSPRTPLDVMIELQAKGIPAAAVHHPRSQFEDPQLGHREFFQPLDQLALGDLFLEGACFKSDTMPLQAAKSAPLLGQHTREICSSLLGLPDAEVERLFEEGVLEETLLE